MNKKIIVVVFIILIGVITLTVIVTRFIQMRTGSSQITPITYNQNPSFNLHSGTVSPTNQPQHSIKGFVPISTNDFSVYYSSEINKYIIDKYSPDANKKIYDWAIQNNIVSLLNNPDIFLIHDAIILKSNLIPSTSSSQSAQTLYTDNTVATNLKTLNDFLKIILNFQSINLDFSNQFIAQNITTTPNISSSPIPPQNFSYYSQCTEPYRNYPLPGGCSVCSAGCGPTAVAMILSSYVDQNYTPNAVVESYRQKGLQLGCGGSSYDSALSMLRQSGLKTTDPIFYNYVTSETLVPDLKDYIQNGWTFFTLVNNQGYGHFIWITNIDQSNHIWAYDSYYGSQNSHPIDENAFYPYPKYRIVIGVKKS